MPSSLVSSPLATMRHKQVRAAPSLMPKSEAIATSSPTVRCGWSAPSNAVARTERALSDWSPIKSATRSRRSSTAGTRPSSLAKEAPLVNAREGAVVLSVNAGAAEELGPWTVPVDPHDLEGHVRALEDALALPSSRRREHLDGIRAHVRGHDLVHWVDAQLTDLERASTIRRR